MLTPEKLSVVLTTHTICSRFYIAYSGGLDSHVLLHAMSECLKKNPLLYIRAVHINHGLNSKSDQWEQHCRYICEKLKIPFQAERLRLTIHPGDSIEAVARKARYEIFRRIIRDDENILTAHTQNDQTETFLLQLMRGSGVKGLSAMPMKKKLGSGHLLRPLLNFNRHELKVYAEKNHLHWIEDDMNLELRFNRNYLRHEVLPVLQRRWPQVFATVSRSASHCAEAAILLDRLADNDLQAMQTRSKLAIKPLLQLTPERQRNILRRWISREGFLVPQTKQLEQIRKDVLEAKEDANPIFTYGDIEVRRYRNELYLSAFSPLYDDASLIIPWDFQGRLTLPNNLGILQAVKRKGKGIKTALNLREVTVRFRQGGERCRPVGRKDSHSLKKLMQEWRIPVWQRDSIPLIYCNETLVTVVAYCICEGFVSKSPEWGWVISFERGRLK
ncbi:tRNA lysidine(34) synthetase TilS [Coxiella-like endosymbiont]|uniref:tRNA lysidine(34) synthetase TilS n=1 Tax=Coxiella-like endosymbiont TaxID=1592897 RepID=UPI002729B890|nr:tRNA lysidine(34) synthetase TilS [Coxiella-like endosymbiont]